MNTVYAAEHGAAAEGQHRGGGGGGGGSSIALVAKHKRKDQ